MDKQISGIHHVTTIASDPQRNVDFYAGTLGLRLIKVTINFDDPGTYHLYYADETGRPGTVLTFFPWPRTHRGRLGTGQVATTSFLVPEGAMDYWEERLQRLGVAAGKRQRRFDEEWLSFLDPDGTSLELVARAAADRIDPWEDGPVPADYAIRGFHSVTLWENNPERTVALLTEGMGFRLEDEAGPRFRFRTAPEGEGPGMVVDLVHRPDDDGGALGAGIVHHVAWRAADDAQQAAWRRDLLGLGLRVTPIMDRQYFHSIYFREPGGVLFEIATDGPGFAIDETVAELGSGLRLPPWLEPRRAEIETALPRLVLPGNRS